ncbi:MAG: hypothetical protein F4X66_08990 [Chloroflexi bacterium]|nr:hypothetical protein [Chloroflexota bacterium]
MPTFSRSDGTRVEGKHLTVEYADGTKVTASDEDFDIKQNGRSISIPCGPKLFMDILRSGKQPEEMLYAVISSPEWQELARVMISSIAEMRSEGQPPMVIEGHIVGG